jgi:hypothetical protein
MDLAGAPRAQCLQHEGRSDPKGHEVSLRLLSFHLQPNYKASTSRKPAPAPPRPSVDLCVVQEVVDDVDACVPLARRKEELLFGAMGATLSLSADAGRCGGGSYEKPSGFVQLYLMLRS